MYSQNQEQFYAVVILLLLHSAGEEDICSCSASGLCGTVLCRLA